MRDHIEDSTREKTQDSAGRRYGRAAVAELLQEYDAQADEEEPRVRRFAIEARIPRTTLEHWLGRRANLAASPAAVAFFESPEGSKFLYAFEVAAHLVVSGDRLAERMEHKAITVCEDRTFLSEDICLVAMEPVSGFVLAEEHSERRDAASRAATLDAALQGLDVDVVQSTTDEASALALHARNQRAEHSPDLFHVQHEGVKAMALSLAALEERARAVHDQAAAKVTLHVEKERAYRKGPRGRGRSPDFGRRIHVTGNADPEGSPR